MNRLIKVITCFGLGLCLGFMLIALSGCSSEPPIEDWIASSVDPLLAESFKDMKGVKYSAEKTGPNEVTVTFTLDGAAELAVYAQDYDTVRTTWNDLGDSMCSLTNSMAENAHQYGISNITVCAQLKNDTNEDLTLLAVIDGDRVYDCVRDGNQ